MLAGCASVPPGDFEAAALADAMSLRPIVLLGEVHDNETQHAVRAEALRRLVARGARPALAFEQFDRDRRDDLAFARTEPLPAGVTRAEHLISRAGARAWDWRLYRPYLEIALDYDLPIVAANLSRADAMHIAQQGIDADLPKRMAPVPVGVRRAHETALERAHCGTAPARLLEGMANAQMARDLALAEAIRPYFARGVVLLTGNGHVRNDIGIPYWLTREERARTATIGLVEAATDDGEASNADLFDVVFVTPTQPREEPCAALRQRTKGLPG